VAAPETPLRVGGCDVLLLGTIAGFAPDGERVQAAFRRHQPDTVGLGVPAEDLAGLEAIAQDPEAFRGMVPPDDAAGRHLELLKRFGEIRIPSPDLEAAYGLAKAGGVAMEALDLDDHAYAQEYTRRVKLLHLWAAKPRQKRLLRQEFQAADAYDLDAQWDRQANAPKPLRELEALREQAMAARIRALAASSRRLLAVVPAARFAGVAALLRAASPPQG